jgi:hypothetical protein
MPPWPEVIRCCDVEDEGSVVEAAHAGFDLHVLRLQVVQGTERVYVEVLKYVTRLSTLTYWGTAASTGITLEIPGMIETATHADCSADQHGKCKCRWIP